MTNAPPADLPSIINKFRGRAERLRRNSIGFLILIIAVLLGLMLTFVLAGELATGETRLQQRIDATNKSIETIQLEIQGQERVIGKEQQSGSSSDSLANHQATLSALRQQQNSLVDFRQKLERLQLGLPQEPDSVGGKASVTTPDYGPLVSAIATRVGSIVLIVFLVRILVPLYRYNKRLSAYYDARVDALELAHSNRREGDSELELFERLTPSLSPDHIDFSQAPASPTQEVLDFVRQVFTSKLSK